MTTPAGTSHDSAAASKLAAAQLAGLQTQIADAQALLVRLMQDVVEVESLQTLQAQHLQEANEQLVIAALQAQGDADTAALALQNLSHVAEHDPLTGLSNRILFHDRLQHAMDSAGRSHGSLALLFVDLDGFKQINDSHGHVLGDLVLQQVAQRLLSVVRAADTVSRHGGDEFLLLLTEVVRPVDAVIVAHKLLAALAAPMQLQGLQLQLSASIGISLYPDDAAEPRQLLQNADAAMYRAKRLGPGHVVSHGRLNAAEMGLVAQAAVAAGATANRARRPVEPERLHAQLREANEKLVLTALDAETLRDAALQAQARQSALIEAVAQELRNPSAPIRIAASMLGRLADAQPLLPRLQTMVEQQVAQMSRLVGDLLDVSRLGSGGLELALEVVDVAAVVDAALRSWRPLLAVRHQQLLVMLPGAPLLAHGNAERLAQIVNNLVDNAAKHTHDHGQIEVSLEAQGDKVVLVVADNGIGITAQALPRIFEPFAQDTQAIGFNGVGLGIGLTVVRALLQALGGSITASSAGSRLGSRFVVTLPRAGAPADPAAAPGAAPPAGAGAAPAP
ncbi:MAG: diguanylate cyclase [Aquabacterium sp.]|nr:diguanylate cyclase [Aquabacterium sp.]